MTTNLGDGNLGSLLRETGYPAAFRNRNTWIRAQREARNAVDPRTPYGLLEERERSADGRMADTYTVFLTNRECPWSCFMCDLWQNTLEESVPVGAIPQQLEYAFEHLGVAREPATRAEQQLKLYNSGSFFDPKAIPVEDYPTIARQVRGFETVIVESHPRLIGARCREWGAMIESNCEVAMGLETVHPTALDALNKGFGWDDFRRASERLLHLGMTLRVFVLVNVPFVPPEEQREWTRRSVAACIEIGASVICLIPVRSGDGAMKQFSSRGRGTTRLSQLEDALDDAISLGPPRAFADLWDLGEFSRCRECFEARRARLLAMNESQTSIERIGCAACECQ